MTKIMKPIKFNNNDQLPNNALRPYKSKRKEECTIPVVSGSLPLVSDKDIEAWADKVQPARGGYKSDYIFSAKAMRDGKIKASGGK